MHLKDGSRHYLQILGEDSERPNSAVTAEKREKKRNFFGERPRFRRNRNHAILKTSKSLGIVELLDDDDDAGELFKSDGDGALYKGFAGTACACFSFCLHLQ